MSCHIGLPPLLGPGSALHRKYYRGNAGEYARALTEQLQSSIAPADIEALRAEARHCDESDVYDAVAVLYSRLVPYVQQIGWGRFMSSWSLSTWKVQQIPLGKTTADTAAGIGTIMAAARAASPHVRTLGVEIDEELILFGGLARVLTEGTAETEWCIAGDMLEIHPPQRVDSLLLSPPWILRDQAPASMLATFSSIDAYREQIEGDELFDVCVPYLIESTRMWLKPGGYFLASVPARVRWAPEWAHLRNGDLFRNRGIEAEVQFRDVPTKIVGRFPVRYEVLVGRRDE